MFIIMVCNLACYIIALGFPRDQYWDHCYFWFDLLFDLLYHYMYLYLGCIIMEDRSFNRGFPSSVRCSI